VESGSRSSKKASARDHALERIAAIEKHLGITKKIAA
jgi:hypothetical protein